MGRGLTLNLGIRFDQETQPPFDPTRFPTVISAGAIRSLPASAAPTTSAQRQAQGVCQLRPVLRHHEDRLGARFLRQRLLARLRVRHGRCRTTPSITPPLSHRRRLPGQRCRAGVNVGRFIENVDFRATKADTRDPAIDPNMKPMKQHEFVTGVDWAVNPLGAGTFRYARKRLGHRHRGHGNHRQPGFLHWQPRLHVRRRAASPDGHPRRQR